jgi:hypothetical protein
VSPDILEEKIREILDYRLDLEDGEMMMPLKRTQIDALLSDIRGLVNDAVSEATQ